MTRKEKRIKICEDVIKQLRYLQVVPGIYCNVSTYLDEDKQLSEQPQLKRNCDVCAKGAMLIGYIDVCNKLKVYDVFGRSYYGTHYSASEHSISSVLTKIFSQTQLDMIECAFEGFNRGINDNVNGDSLVDGKLGERCAKWVERYPDDKKRLSAIMRNVIKNDGRFVP